MTSSIRSKSDFVEYIVNEEVFTDCGELVSVLLEANGGEYTDTLIPAMSKPDYCEPPAGYIVASREGQWAWRYDDDTPEDECDWGDGCLYPTEEEANKAAWGDANDAPDHLEVIRYYLVSSWLAEKLEHLGEPVALDVAGQCIWGCAEETMLREHSAIQHLAGELAKPWDSEGYGVAGNAMQKSVSQACAQR